MTDIQRAALLSLLLSGIATLTPLVGAIVAAVFVRRRGRNARLALAGCLVMLAGPIVSFLGMALGLDALMRAFGPLMAQNVLSVFVAPFQLVGFGLVLAGALTAPARPSTPFGGPPVTLDTDLRDRPMTSR
ncbi:hypothetical protein GCM10009665_43820 [Kitasatospora nipponensis]|uniref:Uncharacterized protein n=1 Tax=Kitasatospora nipponensis TaxID=258049 RepID=A0ABN1WLB6_9ACTN